MNSFKYYRDLPKIYTWSLLHVWMLITYIIKTYINLLGSYERKCEDLIYFFIISLTFTSSIIVIITAVIYTHEGY